MSKSTLENKQLAKLMADKVIDEIGSEIENRTIEVRKQKEDVQDIIKERENKKRAKKLSKHTLQHTVEELNEMKLSKIMEIKEIQRQENMLKKSSVLKKSNVSKSCTRLWKSDFTQEEMNELKKILKKQKQYERQLKKKEKNLQNWLQDKRKEDEELKRQFVNEQCEQRRKELTKQREELEKKKQERALLMQEQIKKIKEHKNQKLLHNQMSQSWKKYEETSEKEKIRLWEMQKERGRINSKQIEQHEAKYLEMKKEQQKKREKVLEQSRASKFHLPYIHAHAQIFFKVQKEEEEKNKQEEMKIREMQNNIIKKKEYGKHVIDAFLPKVKYSTEKDDEKKSPNKTLNVEESYKLGNDYMRTAHEKVTSLHLEKQKKSLQITEQPAGNSIFYKNYLKDIKSEQKQNKSDPLEAVENTLKSNKLSDVDKLHKVKMMFEKDQSTKKSDTEMVETIKTKMKVLQEIMR